MRMQTLAGGVFSTVIADALLESTWLIALLLLALASFHWILKRLSFEGKIRWGDTESDTNKGGEDDE